MEIGTLLPWSDIGGDPSVVREYAQAAEAIGDDFVEAPDHVLGAREGDRTGAVLAALKGLPEVEAVHITNGRWDMLAELNTAGLPDFSRVLDRVHHRTGYHACCSLLLL